MAEYRPLADFYSGWPAYQDLLTRAIAPLLPEHLALPAGATGGRTVGQIAAHIIACRVSWFHRLMGEGSDALTPLDDWDLEGAPARSAAELEEGLEATWRMIAGCLARWTQDDLDATFRHPRRQKTLTRGWVLWHVLEHDLHHGGEISLALGAHGLPAIDI